MSTYSSIKVGISSLKQYQILMVINIFIYSQLFFFFSVLCHVREYPSTQKGCFLFLLSVFETVIFYYFNKTRFFIGLKLIEKTSVMTTPKCPGAHIWPTGCWQIYAPPSRTAISQIPTLRAHLLWQLICGRPSVGRSTPHRMAILQSDDSHLIPTLRAHMVADQV